MSPINIIEYENLYKLNKSFFDDYKETFEKIFDSGWFILGNQVTEFEKSFASYCGSQFCAGVANGLDALILSLKAFEFPAGKEVIVPSNTYIATILSILHCGLKPVLVEPDIATYTLDPSKIENSITGNTVAIMVVHLYGKCCEMNLINNTAKRYGLKVIEDCAQAHGATFKGKKAGTFGHFGAFSFYPTKNLGALGDGGCVNSDDESLISTIKTLRNYGSQKKYYNEIVGYNSRLDEIQAGFLSVKLKHLEAINKHKKKLATLYSAGLKNDFIKPVEHPDYSDVYHIYAIRHPKRDQLKNYLQEHNIKTEIHYPVPPHQQMAVRPVFFGQHYPISEEIHRTILSLPISYFHTEKDVEKVIETMNKFL